MAEANLDWSGDEVVMLFGSGIVCFLGVAYWMLWLSSVPQVGPRKTVRAPMVVAILLAIELIVAAAWYWSAKEVRHGQSYTLLMVTMGIAWLMACSSLFSWMGLSVRDDACERQNLAAASAICGGLLGVGLVFCGANTGEGPSFWNNVFSAVLGTVAWYALWLLLDLGSGVSRTVTEDRDVATGIRLGAYLTAQGLVFGRALAGNWHSAVGTVWDFLRYGWPAAAVLAVATLAERSFRPSLKNPFPSAVTRGWPMAAVYLVMAGAWILRLGWWEGAPQ